jgi:hypothetical protein
MVGHFTYSSADEQENIKALSQAIELGCTVPFGILLFVIKLFNKIIKTISDMSYFF